MPSATVSLIVAVGVIGGIDVIFVPWLLREQATDWLAYDQAARALKTHALVYPWANTADIRGPSPYPYLYPPALAGLWALGFAASSWAVLKVLSLAAVAALALRRPGADGLTSRSAVNRATLAAGVTLVALSLATPPVVFDLILGNVMTLYVAAFALVAAAPDRWWSATPLGFLLAIAFKPFVLPLVVWMLVRRSGQLVGLVVAAGVVSLASIILLGPAVHLEYLGALPKLSGLATPFSGNLGLSTISLPLAFAGIAVSAIWAAWAAGRVDLLSGLAIATALTLIAQPTLGLNYAGVLIPAIVVLWRVDRAAGLMVVVACPLMALISPPLAGVVVATVASIVGRSHRGAGSRSLPAGAPVATSLAL